MGHGCSGYYDLMSYLIHVFLINKNSWKSINSVIGTIKESSVVMMHYPSMLL